MLPDGWKEERLSELLKNKTITVHIDGNHGSFYPKKEEFVSSGVPYISANCIQNGRIDFQKCKFLAPEKADKLQKGIAKDGDVLFAHNATVGPVALLKTNEERIILSTTLTLYRCDPIKLNNSFLYQYMSSTYFDTQYESIMRQTTRNQVPITAQREFVFLIPPLPEQKKIAAILSTWDRAIEGTEKLLANSQQQKKALMQQLLTGKKRLPGFTGEWKIGTISEIAHIDTGFAFKSSEFTDDADGMPVVRMSDLKDGILNLESCKRLNLNSLSGLTKFSLKENDFIFGMSGSLSNFAWVKNNNLPCYLNQRVGRIRSKTIGDQKFISYLYLSEKIQKEIEDKAAGAAQLNISLNDIRGMKIKIPPLPEQKAIAAVLSTADEEITALESDLLRLRQEKKALMQQLLTGKRRVTVD